jgi:predicted RNA-binding protein with PIN domain
VAVQEPMEEYLLVDGYNIIFAWDELKALASFSLDAARDQLIALMCDFNGMRNLRLILVFDAYRVAGGRGSVEKRGNVDIVYTKEAETADAYIEKAAYELRNKRRVRVATSDGMEQLIILASGALRISAREFRQEVEQTEGELKAFLERNAALSNGNPVSETMREAMRRLKEKTDRGEN